MFEGEGAILSELLRERNLVGADQFRELQEEHERTGKPLSQVIIDFGLVSEEQLLRAVAEHLNLEYISLDDIDIDKAVLRIMPSSVARMYSAVPVSIAGNTVTVAVMDPYNPQLVGELSFILGKDVQLAVAPSKQIEEAILRNFGEESESLKDVLEDMESQLASAEVVETAAKTGGTAALEELASQAPIVRFVNLMLFQAIQDRASDIHFEPFEDEFKVRYRVDGALYEMAPPPKHLALPVISRIKVMSNLNIAERRLPQDGRIQLNIGGKQVDLACFDIADAVRRIGGASCSGPLRGQSLVGKPGHAHGYFREDALKPSRRPMAFSSSPGRPDPARRRRCIPA